MRIYRAPEFTAMKFLLLSRMGAERALKFNHRKGKLCCGHALADIGVHYTERQSPNYNYEMTFSGLGCILVVSFRELPAH